MTFGATVEPAKATLSVEPGQLELRRGANGSAAVTIQRYGLVGDVTLAVTSPQGMFWSFTPPVAAGASATLTLTATATVLPGPHDLMVTGTAGSLQVTPARLRVDVLDATTALALSATPTDLELQPGASHAVVVTISRTAEIGPVSLVVAPQVTGVTVSVVPNPATGTSSTLTLQVADDAAPGQHTLTVTGTAGSLTGSAAVTLRIIERPDGRMPILLEDDFEGADRWTPTARRYRRTDEGLTVPDPTNPWVHAITPQQTGGNPTGYRRMSHMLTAETAPVFTSLFVEHAFTSANGVVYEYDPRAQGAITSLDYTEDRIVTQFATYGTLFVRQNGIVYVLASSIDPGTQQFTNTTWERFTVTGLTATSFQAAPGFAPASPPRPDFSANGAPLQFGFIRGTTARFPITHVHGVDNWRLTIHRE